MSHTLCVLLWPRRCDILARRQPHSSAPSSVARLPPEAWAAEVPAAVHLAGKVPKALALRDPAPGCQALAKSQAYVLAP